MKWNQQERREVVFATAYPIDLVDWEDARSRGPRFYPPAKPKGAK